MGPQLVDESRGLPGLPKGVHYPARVLHIGLLPWWSFVALFMMWATRNFEEPAIGPTRIFVVVWALAVLSVWWWLFVKLDSWRREGREAAWFHPIVWAIALPFIFPVAFALLIPPFRRALVPRLPRQG